MPRHAIGSVAVVVASVSLSALVVMICEGWYAGQHLCRECSAQLERSRRDHPSSGPAPKLRAVPPAAPALPEQRRLRP